MKQWEVWMHSDSAPQAAVPQFLALPVSWVMMHATLAASVGKVWGWRLNTSWHCAGGFIVPFRCRQARFADLLQGSRVRWC